jgi:Tfp pilus assembly protein PilN
LIVNKQLEKYFVGNHFAGIEVELRGDSHIFHVILLQRIGNKLLVQKRFDEFASIDEFPEKIVKAIPVAVVVTGKGVLYRQIQTDEAASSETLLRKILPNVNVNDFFISSVKNGSEHYVSLTRKAGVNNILEKLKKVCSVISLDVGCQCLSEIKSLLPELSTIRSGRSVVAFDASRISAIEYLTEESSDAESDFIIGGQNIPNHALTAFSIAFRLVTGNFQSMENGFKDDFIQRKIFRTTLRAALVLIFLALIINYFAFSHYWNRQQQLEIQLGAGGNQISEVNLLRQQVDTRTTFLQNAGLINNTSFAWYADQLGHNLPEGIRLSQMNFSPRVKMAEEDSIGFHTNAIEISGNCEESIILNRWIQFLKSEHWITSASIRSYEQGKTDATGKFTLDLRLH